MAGLIPLLFSPKASGAAPSRGGTHAGRFTRELAHNFS